MLYRPMPKLPTASTKTESIQIGVNDGSRLLGDDNDDLHTAGGKWEDEEERRFYEDIQDLKDFVPWSVLGIEKEAEPVTETEESLQSKADKEKEEVRKLEEELQKLADTNEIPGQEANGAVLNEDSDDEYESMCTNHCSTNTRSACQLLWQVLRKLALPVPHR